MKKPNRRRQRGSSMVEALIALVFITVLFACALYLHAAYAAQYETFDQATSQAVQQAMASCGPPLGGFSSFNDFVNGSRGGGAPDGALLGAPPGTTNKMVSIFRVAPAILGGATLQLRTKADILCNEPALSRDAAIQSLGLLDWSAGQLLGAAGF